MAEKGSQGSDSKSRIIKKIEPRDVEKIKPNPNIVGKGEKIKKDIDKVLDEIDTVLEQNAEEFIKNYVQRGGE